MVGEVSWVSCAHKSPPDRHERRKEMPITEVEKKDIVNNVPMRQPKCIDTGHVERMVMWVKNKAAHVGTCYVA